MHQNECKYDTLLHSSKRAQRKNTFKNLDLAENNCRIINILCSKDLYNTAGQFYSSGFNFRALTDS